MITFICSVSLHPFTAREHFAAGFTYPCRIGRKFAGTVIAFQVAFQVCILKNMLMRRPIRSLSGKNFPRPIRINNTVFRCAAHSRQYPLQQCHSVNRHILKPVIVFRTFLYIRFTFLGKAQMVGKHIKCRMVQLLRKRICVCNHTDCPCQYCIAVSAAGRCVRSFQHRFIAPQFQPPEKRLFRHVRQRVEPENAAQHKGCNFCGNIMLFDMCQLVPQNNIDFVRIQPLQQIFRHQYDMPRHADRTDFRCRRG